MKANFKIKEEDKGKDENENKKSTEMTDEEFGKKGENVWTYRSKSRQR
jgi:hypothetical protein